MTRSVPEAIILVGGFGTRLRNVVAELPKCLASVNNRPFLAYLLDFLASAGIQRSILATGYLANQVEAAMGHDWRGMELEYSVEETPLGTGGAVRKATARMTSGAPVIVLNGDTFLDFEPLDFTAAMVDAGAKMGVALAEVPDVTRYGEVEWIDGYVMRFGEKTGRGPGWINAGVYYLSQAAIMDFPDREAFSLEKDVLRPAAEAGLVHAYAKTAKFIDIGTPEDYAKAQGLAKNWLQSR